MCLHYSVLSHTANGLEGNTYTNGSYFADLNKCGSAAVMSDGRVLVCKPPGHPGIYQAELVALHLAVIK